MNCDLHLIAASNERLVHAVVYDFVHQVMEPIEPGAADVHRGTLPYSLEALKDPYLGGIVGLALVSDVHIETLRFSAHTPLIVL
jgi:hypothetical protein